MQLRTYRYTPITKALFITSSQMVAYLSLFAGSTYAATVTGNVVKGINVTGYGVYDATLVGSPTTPSTYDTAFGQAAMQAFVDELNEGGSLYGSTLDTEGVQPGKYEYYYTFLNTSTASTVNFLSLLNWGVLGGNSIDTGSAVGYFASVIANTSGYYSVEWSKVSTVPLPPAVLLFAPALLGFLGLRRKSKLVATA